MQREKPDLAEEGLAELDCTTLTDSVSMVPRPNPISTSPLGSERPGPLGAAHDRKQTSDTGDPDDECCDDQDPLYVPLGAE
jgi:hypothetical protein